MLFPWVRVGFSPSQYLLFFFFLSIPLSLLSQLPFRKAGSTPFSKWVKPFTLSHPRILGTARQQLHGSNG
uniref:Putative secreted protein n=1 Tax=Anopheles darlingi TaxID=43151 RepID=A0A2M4DQG7_ANODA